MLRELREYTAECDVPEGGDDCHEIIQVQAPDETNALKALEGKGWVVQMRSEEYTPVPWAWLACPHCALGLS